MRQITDFEMQFYDEINDLYAFTEMSKSKFMKEVKWAGTFELSDFRPIRVEERFLLFKTDIDILSSQYPTNEDKFRSVHTKKARAIAVDRVFGDEKDSEKEEEPVKRKKLTN